MGRALASYKSVGSPFPSQRRLLKKLVRPLPGISGQLVVEWGTGNGCTTEAILGRMDEDSHLLAFESDPSLYQVTRNRIGNDPRLTLVLGRAEDTIAHLTALQKKADFVVSSLPLGSLKKAQVFALLRIAKSALGGNGQFIQYQYLCQDLGKVKKVFSEVKVGFALNIPPAFIYYCRS
jgi:phospholipid N-methyltransferase